MAQVIDGVYYNGEAIDGLIEDLEGAYDDLAASDSAMGAAFDAYELAKKRVEEDAAKVAQLRERLAQVYPVTKGMVWDHAIAKAKEYRAQNKEVLRWAECGGRVNKFAEGRQPCADFNPKRESNGYADWDNVHECYGPFDDSGRPRCGGTVSFCENCYSDHHIDGWDTCPQPRIEDEA